MTSGLVAWSVLLSVSKGRGAAFAVGAIVLLALVGFAVAQTGRGAQSTDDAFVDGDVVAVAAEMPGRVLAVQAPDNALVQKGAVLVELDPKDIQYALDGAQAAEDGAQAQRDALPSSASRQAIQGADAALRGATAKREQAQSALAKTKLVAPITGYVSHRAVVAGDLVQAGQPLLALVSPNLWVTANFKETEIARIKPGQPVDIRLDAYPALRLKGHVQSLQRASGQAFSLMPPDNASGNFVKVVQRVPVKITLNALPAGAMLGPGMSVRVRVDER
jgi:membrane fusion protein (multidrug efflux system)